MEHALLAALQWDPHIRGFLIVLVAFLILPGSVYLLLSTNTGARLGLLLAVTGLSGWMAAMGGIWMVYGIGLKGREPHWKPLEIVTGDVSQATTDPMREFPKGEWKQLKAGDKILADAQAAADNLLAPPKEVPHSEHSAHPAPPTAEEKARFASPFKSPTEYLPVTGYETGGENCWAPGGGSLCADGGAPSGKRNMLEKAVDRLERGPWHSPHYTVIQVQPVKEVEATPGEVVKPERDTSAPITTVVLVRDLGSLRFPPFVVMVSMGTVFAICCYVLHQRDKEIQQARAATLAA